MHTSLRFLLTAALLISVAPAAFAHSDAAGSGFAGGFVSGFLHPILGWDHVAAMVAVGLWGAFLGAPAIWVLPVVFPMVMAFGAMLGILGMPLPFVEVGIAASAIVIGLLIAAAMRLPLAAAAVIVGAFAIFHGHAHGTELPYSVSPFAYASGFVIATGLMHLIGIAFGLLVESPKGRIAVRTAGGVIAAAGGLFLVGLS